MMCMVQHIPLPRGRKVLQFGIIKSLSRKEQLLLQK